MKDPGDHQEAGVTGGNSSIGCVELAPLAEITSGGSNFCGLYSSYQEL